LLYVIALNYEGTWKKRLVAAFSILAIGGAINAALFVAFGAYITTFGVPPPRQSDVHLLFEMIASLLLSLTVALLLQNFKNIRRNTAVLPAVWVSVLAIPLSSIAVSLLVAYADGISTPVQIFIICVMFGISVFVFYLLDRISASHAARMEAAMHAQEKDYYLAQIRTMQESVSQVKGIRHDMKNHLAAISAYALENKGAEIAAYISALHSDIGETALHSNTGNIAFDSIINFKLKNVKQENIQTEICLALPKTLGIETSDVAAILGNLLDNALEAVARAQEKKLTIDIEYKRGALFIQIKNTFDGVLRYAGEGEGKRIATRKESADHGRGLKNIARAAEKYNGYMDIAHDAQTFTAVVFLYVDG